MLREHPEIAWVARMNTGGRRNGRLRYGFPGLSDIIGQLKTGEFFANESKVPGKKPDPGGNQDVFLDKVNRNGGVAFYSTSAQDCREKLDEHIKRLRRKHCD
jgi:hypothetical protein